MGDLLECAGLARSSYYYAMAHPKQPTRPELWGKVAEVFSRTPNGCGHRQIAMCLRAEDGVTIAEKTVLKIMNEMGIRCGIRKETGRRRYGSYRGLVGKTFENLIGRDFEADAPWQKMGTDVTEFKQAWGKAYFAPVYDFGSKEIVAWSTSMSPNMAQQFEVLDQLVARMPGGAHPSCIPIWGGSTRTRAGWTGWRARASRKACRARATASTTAPPSRSSTISRTSSTAARGGRVSRNSSETSTRAWSIGTRGGGRLN